MSMVGSVGQPLVLIQWQARTMRVRECSSPVKRGASCGGIVDYMGPSLYVTHRTRCVSC